ncbi:MAG: SIS domain-containing protein [Planctomycetota bacterium]
MCGIIAVLRRRNQRPVPAAAEVRADVEGAIAELPEGSAGLQDAAPLLAAAERLERVHRALWGPAGIRCLLGDAALEAEIDRAMSLCEGQVEALETSLDASEAALPASQLEQINAALVRLKDAVWTVRRDRLRAARAVADLAGVEARPAAIEAFHSIEMALSALDRLEVRGRDSAGLHILVVRHGLDLDGAQSPDLQTRTRDALFTSRAVRTPSGHLSFVYKAAAEIGELGDNTKALREAIKDDVLLHTALQASDAEAIVVGHTRWASVGIISQANAHPLNQEEVDRPDGPYVVASLNGDVDNYADLKARDNLQIAAEITTDAKVIPALVSRRLAEGQAIEEAFRLTVASFEGSVAIAGHAADTPDQLLLALRGSGQALYVGLCEDAYIVASEPYGVVEETSQYVRMDGETPGNPENAAASQGQILVLDRGAAGSLAGIRRIAYDGTELPWQQREVIRTEITTRDIDRGAFQHFLLKEISEAPRSFRKTLRAKIVENEGRLHVQLSDDTLPKAVRAGLRQGRYRRLYVIGQGTAAVAGQGVAAIMSTAIRDPRIQIIPIPATELSGFRMRDDMSDALVVAISQSGTTTDTNRTVDLVRGRGAQVIGIVNRRNSDLTDKADGVLYTSDGRDVEMSVASTKAFYAQIAAGAVLACALAEETGDFDPAAAHELLTALRQLPSAMEQVLQLRGHVAKVARAHAPRRRYWAVVGNGNNRIAAQEIRIKLSELCYKSIACDSTEDKKHIDLSAEPLILVCAPGLGGSNVDDVAKEVAIYRAHKAAPIVIASEDERRFGAALDVIAVPAVHPALDFVLAAVAGHLFGYEAALAIDELAHPLRESRAGIERLTMTPPTDGDLLRELAKSLTPHTTKFFQQLHLGAYDGNMEASTGVRLASLLRFGLGSTPLDSFAVEHGRPGTPGTVLEELTAALTRGIEELTRPVDAIKHQAKTVTVGISRADEELLRVPLIKALLAAEAPRDRLSYRDLRTLAALNPALDEVLGHTRYRIDGDLEDDTATIHVVGTGGVATGIPSRTAQDPSLRGTKKQVAGERRVLVAKGASDARTVILVPEVADGTTTGLTLMHVRFRDRVSPSAMRGVLRGYRDRYDTLRNAVTETEPSFREDLLGALSVTALLTEPITALVEKFRG